MLSCDYVRAGEQSESCFAFGEAYEDSCPSCRAEMVAEADDYREAATDIVADLEARAEDAFWDRLSRRDEIMGFYD